MVTSFSSRYYIGPPIYCQGYFLLEDDAIVSNPLNILYDILIWVDKFEFSLGIFLS